MICALTSSDEELRFWNIITGREIMSSVSDSTILWYLINIIIFFLFHVFIKYKIIFNYTVPDGVDVFPNIVVKLHNINRNLKNPTQ